MLLPEEKSTCIFMVIRTAYHQTGRQPYFSGSGSFIERPDATDRSVDEAPEVMFADGRGRADSMAEKPETHAAKTVADPGNRVT
jgi:hypothetical protein